MEAASRAGGLRVSISETADEYLDRFLASDHGLVRIRDERFRREELLEVLQRRIRERGLEGVYTYVFLGDLYLEKS